MIKLSPTQVRSAISGLVLTAATLVGVLELEGYTDHAIIPVPGDVPTIGPGRTEGVKMGDKTEPVREMIYLLNNLEGKYAQGVRNCVKVDLYQHEFDAYVSLAYNIGVGAFCRQAQPGKPPNLIDLINAGEYAEACKRIEAFNRGPSPGKDAAGNRIPGPVLKGLVNRRAKERKICEGRA